MTSQKILSAMLEFVRDNSNPRVVATATPVQVEFDSLDVIELVMVLEEEFDREIPDEWIDEEALKNKSFNELATMLAAKWGEEAPLT